MPVAFTFLVVIFKLFDVDCCVRLQVSEACMPVCIPSTLPDNFDRNQCGSDLFKLLECGAGKGYTTYFGISFNTAYILALGKCEPAM